MSRCRALMESFTLLCVSFLSSLFTLPFLLPLSVTFSSGSSFLSLFLFFSSFLPLSYIPPLFFASESFTVTFKALCSDCISFSAFYKPGPSENEEEHGGNWVSPSMVPFSFLAPQTPLLCESSRTKLISFWKNILPRLFL